MRLLIITQKIDRNDDVLGFFHTWVENFGRRFESVSVICLYKGHYDFAENIAVFSLGKEDHLGRARYLARFYRHIWSLRNSYDAVFIHMNPQYVLLGGPVWRAMGKKILLWYAHGSVTAKLRLATVLAHKVTTSTPEGFRIDSDKVEVIGQGIDVHAFSPGHVHNIKKTIVSVGRISPSKGYETLIEAVHILADEGLQIPVDIFGSPGLDTQEKYFDRLKRMVAEKGIGHLVHFRGSVPNRDLPRYLREAYLFVSTSQTGSLDKAILESMACGVPAVTCNDAAIPILNDYKALLSFERNDHRALADVIKSVMNMDGEEYERMRQDLRRIVVENHSIRQLTERVHSVAT
jgi:glycosyltransferase involved in cell wall biosynthesis